MWNGSYLTWTSPNGWVSFEEEETSEECILVIAGMVWQYFRQHSAPWHTLLRLAVLTLIHLWIITMAKRIQERVLRSIYEIKFNILKTVHVPSTNITLPWTYHFFQVTETYYISTISFKLILHILKVNLYKVQCTFFSSLTTDIDSNFKMTHTLLEFMHIFLYLLLLLFFWVAVFTSSGTSCPSS